MNKKYLFLGLFLLIGIGTVSALAYYAVFSSTFTILPSVTISDNTEQTLGDVLNGDTIYGEPITITNHAETERQITITNDASEDVKVSYISDLELTKKQVDFNSDNWAVLNDKVQIRYTLVGDEFNTEVENPIEGYVLVYYKDNDDRFTNPATAINVNEISGNLPNEDDANLVNDYSLEYPTTPHGAKIWYVPVVAVNQDGTINWNLADQFYFESKLIQYNSNGEIVLYGNSEITITPVYEVSPYAEGEVTITTTIA
jgi:hypothetical protein